MRSELLLDGVSHPYHLAAYAHSGVGLVLVGVIIMLVSWIIVEACIYTTKKLIAYWQAPKN